MTADANAPIEVVGVDVADGLKRLRGNAKLYYRLLGTLVNNAQDEVGFFAVLPTEEKRDEVRGRAHKLKGAASNLGATKIQKTAEKLENLARDAASPFSAVTDCISEYVAVCNEFVADAKAKGI